MARMPSTITLRIKADKDVLRLLTYREVLRDFAETAPPYSAEGEIARETLAKFGDER